jgi:signal transduction histidine kinase
MAENPNNQGNNQERKKVSKLNSLQLRRIVKQEKEIKELRKKLTTLINYQREMDKKEQTNIDNQEEIKKNNLAIHKLYQDNIKYEKALKVAQDKKDEEQSDFYRTMLLDNNVDEAKKYMKNLMEKNIAVTNLPIVVNSSMINAILSSKFSECKDKDIECKARVTGDISKDMEMDICIILANIIDNAIKASEKEDEPYIGLEMYREKNYLNIIVENKISESVLHANPKLTTSKKDKKKHGLGLLSVKSTVERYGGMLDCYEKDNKFVVKVVLKAD